MQKDIPNEVSASDRSRLLRRLLRDEGKMSKRSLINDTCAFVCGKDLNEESERLLNLYDGPCEALKDINEGNGDNSTYKRLKLNAFFKLIGVLNTRRRFHRRDVSSLDGVLLNNMKTLLDHVFYFFDMMYGERVVVVFLSRDARYLHAYAGACGDLYECSMQKGALCDVCKQYPDSYCIVVHSHPGGDPTISATDGRSFEFVKSMMSGMKIELIDAVSAAIKDDRIVFSSYLRSTDVYKRVSFFKMYNVSNDNKSRK